MSSTAIKRFLAVFSFAFVSCCALAKDRPPRDLQEPVLGLRFPLASAKLDALPDDVRNKCSELADNENWKGRLWVYATAHDAGGTYYVVGGYYERPKREPSESRYYLDTSGAVFQIVGNQCTGYGGGREVFDARYFEETPQPLLQRLADDLASRLARAFGGPDRLRDELRNQRIDPDTLPAELHEAFKGFFPH